MSKYTTVRARRGSVDEEPISHNCTDRGSDNAISNLVDHPIRECSPDFGLPIIRSNDGNNGGQYADPTGLTRQKKFPTPEFSCGFRPFDDTS
jgi:hypothetical protein